MQCCFLSFGTRFLRLPLCSVSIIPMKRLQVRKKLRTLDTFAAKTDHPYTSPSIIMVRGRPLINSSWGRGAKRKKNFVRLHFSCKTMLLKHSLVNLGKKKKKLVPRVAEKKIVRGNPHYVPQMINGPPLIRETCIKRVFFLW